MRLFGSASSTTLADVTRTGTQSDADWESVMRTHATPGAAASGSAASGSVALATRTFSSPESSPAVMCTSSRSHRIVGGHAANLPSAVTVDVSPIETTGGKIRLRVTWPSAEDVKNVDVIQSVTKQPSHSRPRRSGVVN